VEDVRSLVDRAKAGKLEAYGAIVRRFQDMAVGYGYAVLGDFYLAEDAAQEAFIEAYRDLGKLRDAAAFPGWFRRIVFKHCDRLRRGKRIEATKLIANRVASAEPGPGAGAELHEMKERVLKAVGGLPENERTVTTLFYIDGYSQKDIADFLEVPATTVNNRLHASRKRLKKRMIAMVKETLEERAPDERFSKRVIEGLLARPKPLEIEGHPVRQVWELIRNALPEYEVVEGAEVEDKWVLHAVRDNVDRAYHVSDDKVLRTQMTLTTIKALRGRTPPVKLLAAGRTFRPDREDATHQKVFHQVDGLYAGKEASQDDLKATMQRVVDATLEGREVRWEEENFAVVERPGISLMVELPDGWRDIAGAGILRADVLREVGVNPDEAGGFAFGFGLERMAMLRFGIDDIRKLWKPPYVPG